MKILKERISFEKAEYVFDNGATVVLFLNLESWSYYRGLEDVGYTYTCGTFEEENNSIIDWGGCFALPEEVKFAFKHYGFDTSEIKDHKLCQRMKK